MTGVRLVVGVIVMGILVPVTLFLLLRLQTLSQLFTIAVTTFLTWGVADMLANLLSRPRLKDRSPGKAIREDLERRSKELE
ncbi:MAG TPA: hypothetical protein VGF48_22110 [Thermoanaerobaculia bacterium]